MDSQEISTRSELNIHTYRLVSYGLVAAMMACAAITLTSVIHNMNPDWQPSYLALLCCIVALDRLYTYRFFRDWMFLSKEWLVRVGAQAIVLIVLAKIMVGLSHGLDAFLTEIPLWREDLTTYFFNDELGFALIVVIIVWLVCGNFAEYLEEIGPAQLQSSHLDLARFGLEKNISARQRLVSLYFSVGVVLVFLTMLDRLELHALIYSATFSSLINIPALAASGGSTLLYFMLGLALLSQTQFISLHIRWNTQQIPVNGKLAKQWAGYSLLFLGLITLLVILLPTSYGIEPLKILGSLINTVLLVYFAIGQAVLFLLVYVLGLIYALFGKEPPAPPEEAVPTPTPELPPEAAVATAGPDWWEIAKTLIFWAIFLSVLFFALRQYLQQHQEILEKLRKLPAWRFLEQVWGWLKGIFAQTRSELSNAVQAGRERARQLFTGQGFGDGWINLRRLDPRQRIYFYYLAFIRRGGEKGLPRDHSQTPDEYAAALQTALPAADEDIHALTQAFMSARYSRQPVEAQQAQSVENAWERIRKVFRSKVGRR